ncbi:hypothetical protein [Bacillus toyonensis]|uniref:hypothetical protein n=1 Tax=Bacillus toyonensis TaxID=155322 RepID=UPI002E1D0B0A|nr:hypothetical protein [Bacillus toyonensis]
MKRYLQQEVNSMGNGSVVFGKDNAMLNHIVLSETTEKLKANEKVVIITQKDTYQDMNKIHNGTLHKVTTPLLSDIFTFCKKKNENDNEIEKAIFTDRLVALRNHIEFLYKRNFTELERQTVFNVLEKLYQAPNDSEQYTLNCTPTMQEFLNSLTIENKLLAKELHLLINDYDLINKTSVIDLKDKLTIIQFNMNSVDRHIETVIISAYFSFLANHFLYTKDKTSIVIDRMQDHFKETEVYVALWYLTLFAKDRGYDCLLIEDSFNRFSSRKSNLKLLEKVDHIMLLNQIKEDDIAQYFSSSPEIKAISDYFGEEIADSVSSITKKNKCNAFFMSGCISGFLEIR